MKKFLYKFLLFLLPLIALFVFIEFSLRNIDSIYELKRNGIITQSDSIEILIMGNSHANDGINPTCFRLNAYSLANATQSLLYDKELLLKYLPKLKNLKYVIFSIDYPSLYWGFIEERDFFYYNYFGINIRNKSYLKENLSFFFYVYSPLTSIKLLYSNTFINKKNKMINGWTGYDFTNYNTLTREYAVKRVENFNNDIKNSKEHNYICKEFESLIIYLLDRNITPILITPPCHKYLTECLDSNIQKINSDYIQYLTQKYNLKYLNSEADTAFKSNHFVNVDHLNKIGAEKYTKMLDRLLFE